ncbi:MAG TPA: hypothetical protein VJX23_03185 [Candidatus Binataceae bacterium]|nr:hypothetical protein [Candidatus Binataceae bacterium]
METPQEYYKHHGPMTQLGVHAAQIRALPVDIPALCDVVQGLLIHRDWQGLYNVKLPDERVEETHLRSAETMLARIVALDGRALGVARAPECRIVSTCRDFSLMLAAFLKEQGTPARARCGFGAYFMPGEFVDHWVCEYWNAAQSQWLLVDAQLDSGQRRTLRLDFDPLDTPRDRFIIAGDAWNLCRAGRADPARFGIFNMHGTWFIAGNVLRDLASLNRMELLPWDSWGLMTGPDATFSAEQTTLLDRIAALTLADDGAFSDVRAIYDDDRLRVPPTIFNAVRNRPETIAPER